MHPLTIQSSNAMRAMAVSASMLAAYAAFSLAERIGRTDNFWSRRIWLTASSAVLGLGIWSMHFFGALEDAAPAESVYSLRLVVLCLLLAFAAASACIRLIAWRPESRTRLIIGSAILGGGVCAMHWLGEVALRSMTIAALVPAWFVLALIAGTATSIAAFWMVFGERHDAARGEWMRVSGSLLLGGGIAITHTLSAHAYRLVPLSASLRTHGTVRGSGNRGDRQTSLSRTQPAACATCRF